MGYSRLRDWGRTSRQEAIMSAQISIEHWEDGIDHGNEEKLGGYRPHVWHVESGDALLAEAKKFKDSGKPGYLRVHVPGSLAEGVREKVIALGVRFI
jgi:hypothetical protein